MNKFLFTLLICYQFSFSQIQNDSSVGISYRYGTFESYIKAHGFDASYQYRLYDWLYGELSFMHLSGTNFNNNFQISSELEQVANTKYISDRAMINTISLKIHLSFINTNRHILSIYYGPSLYWFNSSTYDEVIVNDQFDFWYNNTFGKGIGTVFGLTYLFKLNEKYKIGLDAMMFDDRQRNDGTIVFRNNLNFGLLIQRKF